MRASLVILAGAVVGALGLAAPARGDTVITASGQTFVGQITEDVPERVVIKTESGTVVVPRASVVSIDRGPAPPPVVIVPEKVAPADAGKAFEAAKAAIAKGDWVKAASLLEGLLALDAKAFAPANRVAAASALVTCYLSLKDAKGAAKAFKGRAELASTDTDKQRFLATAEALETVGSVTIGPKGVTTYDEAITAAMEWKAKQVLAEAKECGAKAQDLNEMDKLDGAAKRCVERLDEASLYVPGFAAAHRKETLASLIDNIAEAGRKTVSVCAAERRRISRNYKTAQADSKYAAYWNLQVVSYLKRRQAADDGLKNLKPFAVKFEIADLYTLREKECTELLAQLDGLQYHEVLKGIPAQTRIMPRKIGSPFTD